jgi:DNA-binding GntR family transcriptional regulator
MHADSGDIDRYYEANYVFHDALQQVAGSRWLQHLIGDLRKMLKLSRHRSLMLPGRLKESMAEHEALMAALRKRDAKSAEKVMNRHLLRQLDALRAVGKEAA